MTLTLIYSAIMCHSLVIVRINPIYVLIPEVIGSNPIDEWIAALCWDKEILWPQIVQTVAW